MSTNEDTRKGGLMRLSTCTIGLRKVNSIQPKLLSTANDNVFEDADGDSMIYFDKILQNLVTAMEHLDPFVRKV